MGWFATRDLYTSKTASEITSETYSVEGFHDGFTLQLIGSPSTTTIQGSNDTGHFSTIVNWSTLTTVLSAGLINITPGFGWLRLQRSETSNAIIAGWQRSV
jgi:hypothetical protein